MSSPPYAAGTRVYVTFCLDGELSKHLIFLVGLSAFTLDPSFQKGISKDLFFLGLYFMWLRDHHSACSQPGRDALSSCVGN